MYPFKSAEKGGENVFNCSAGYLAAMICLPLRKGAHIFTHYTDNQPSNYYIHVAHALSQELI